MNFTNFVATTVLSKGMSKETSYVRYMVNRGNTDIGVDEAECGYVRGRILPLLAKLQMKFLVAWTRMTVLLPPRQRILLLHVYCSGAWRKCYLYVLYCQQGEYYGGTVI